MLTAKIAIPCIPVRLESNRIIVKSGDRTDSYNTEYYRVANAEDKVEMIKKQQDTALAHYEKLGEMFVSGATSEEGCYWLLQEMNQLENDMRESGILGGR